VRIQIGKVGKPHGLGGAFVVENASDEPERFAVGAKLLIDGHPARVIESKQAGGRQVIQVEGEVQRGAPIEIERANLPQPREGEYYAFQLVGLEVEEEGGKRLGRVAEVSSGPANDVLELDTGLALPLVDACVQEVDLERGRILVKPGFAPDS
jgi:16S rRNA processing protein RimM